MISKECIESFSIFQHERQRKIKCPHDVIFCHVKVLEDVGVRGILKRPYHPEHLAQANI